MKIGVVGAGYVGLVTATGLAEMGHKVTCVENDDEKIVLLQAGTCPIHEAGLEESIKDCQSQSTLSFVKDISSALEDTELMIIAVGTPPSEDGSADLRALFDVATQIAHLMNHDLVVAIKSTVPVGTAAKVETLMRKVLDTRQCHAKCLVASNPEFLKEGTALTDFRRPDRIVIGSNHPTAVGVLRSAYSHFVRRQMRIIEVSRESAELGKYAANAMLAIRISLMNELSALAEHEGADIEEIRLIVGSDRRIGPDFLYAGPGFGGSCFPKDLRALSAVGNRARIPTDLINSVISVNDRQKQLIPSKLAELLQLPRKATCAVWGLAFKPETADTREAPSVNLISLLLNHGVRVQVFDPVVRHIDSISDDNLTWCSSQYEAASGADALVLMTEWKMFRSPDFHLLKNIMAGNILFDARNIWDHDAARRTGFRYFGIGRKL